MNESNNAILQEDLEYNARKFSEYNQFRNSSFLITGATGLIGSVICKSILCANRLYGCNVTLYALARNENKVKGIFREVLERNEFKIIYCDLMRDSLKIQDDIDYIVHTASITTSQTMVEYPVDTLMTSINGTKNILELAKAKHTKSMVFLSSMEMYGSFASEAYVDENIYGNIDVLDVRSSYSEGKRACENLCVAYKSQYDIPVKIARLAQTFGPGILSDDHRIYAQFAQSVIDGKDIVLHTSGMSEGNYVYISDAVEAIFRLLILGESGEAYNVANEECHMRIRDMAQMVADEIAKGNIKIVYKIQSKNAYAKETKMKMNTQKIKKLGWQPQKSLYDMYDRIIAYIKEQRCI